jgi:two-component system OmpR family response regulator
MQGTLVGLCEDDSELRSVLTRSLEAANYEVVSARTGHEAVERFTAARPQILVLDIGLPDADGRDVCQALRARGVEAPVLFLTARDALTDRLSGFSAGGDDYVTKPFELAELLARVGALGRRSGSKASGDKNGVQLDPGTHAMRLGDQTVALTPTEFRIFATLAAKRSDVLRRSELIAAAWPDGAIVHENTLDAYIARLRRKLVEIGSPDTITTARGVGYSLS